jgi:hypothetical protein
VHGAHLRRRDLERAWHVQSIRWYRSTRTLCVLFGQWV